MNFVLLHKNIRSIILFKFSNTSERNNGTDNEYQNKTSCNNSISVSECSIVFIFPLE